MRLAKEFVKFNERCFVRLLGDMHSSNFVVNVIPDLDEVMVPDPRDRLRSAELRGPLQRVYLPKYYPQNNAVIFLAMQCMTHESVKQYQEEEHALLRLRARAEHEALGDPLHNMSDDDLAPVEHIVRLRQELAHHHRDDRFLRCESMGELVRASLSLLDWE